MRNAIREYIELSETEKKALWDNATFVFDTNVFLNLYRYSKKTRDALLDAMKQLESRIWMPYHVAFEFMKRRPEIIFETVDRYSKLKQEAEKLLHACSEMLRVKKNDPEYLELQKYINQWLSTNKEKNLLVDNVTDDPILERILQLYENKVGPDFTEDEKINAVKDGEIRYAKKIPPGYMDAQKAKNSSDNNAYGDFFVWKQILKYSAENKTSIIFVTHDQKEDWWNIVHGKTIGPRVELRKEFYNNAQSLFHMYTMDSFISHFDTGETGSIDKSVVEEVKSYSELPVGMKIIANAVADYTDLLRSGLHHISVDDFSIAISDLEQKNKRRQANLEDVKRNYYNKKMPPKVRQMVANLEKNIANDEELIEQLKMKKRDTIVRNLR